MITRRFGSDFTIIVMELNVSKLFLTWLNLKLFFKGDVNSYERDVFGLWLAW